jgi:hypothetical protein
MILDLIPKLVNLSKFQCEYNLPNGEISPNQVTLFFSKALTNTSRTSSGSVV